MAKEYIADKDTLDEVNNKVGASSDTASSAPTTLFSGIKGILGLLSELKNLLSDGKTLVANAITAKGVTTAASAAFATMATNIGKISTLATDTADATATAAQILSGKTAYVKGAKVTGTIASKAAATYTPGTTDQTIAAGQYLAGVQTIKGSANLKAENIKSGVDIMGIIGNCIVGSMFLESKTLTLSYNTESGSLTCPRSVKLVVLKMNSSHLETKYVFTTEDMINATGKIYDGADYYSNYDKYYVNASLNSDGTTITFTKSYSGTDTIHRTSITAYY